MNDILATKKIQFRFSDDVHEINIKAVAFFQGHPV